MAKLGVGKLVSSLLGIPGFQGQSPHTAASSPPLALGRFVVCDPSRRLATLVKMLRQDLEQGRQQAGMRTRVIVFTNR